jgi:hypothetical protein
MIKRRATKEKSRPLATGVYCDEFGADAKGIGDSERRNCPPIG